MTGLQQTNAHMYGAIITLSIVMVTVVYISSDSGGQSVKFSYAVSRNSKTASNNGSKKWGGNKSLEPSSPTQYRLDKIRNVCDRQNVTCQDTQKAYSHFLVDDTHRIIYCFIPKVASTSLKALLFKSTGNSIDDIKQGNFHTASTIKNMGLKFLSDYDTQGSQYRLQHYFTFMAVRHPFDRLVSTYKDKVEQGSWSHFYCRLFEERTNSSHVDCPYLRKKITFAMFAELVADDKSYNRHWAEYGGCKPCCIKYDHIVKLETLNDDIIPILNKLSLDHNISVMEHRHEHNAAKAKETSRMFSDVSNATVVSLLDKYALDFEMFGYTWKGR